MRKLFIAAILLLSGIAKPAYSQQIPFYSQYYINPFIYNPAATGTGPMWNTYLIHRSQWSGFPGAPVTSAITIDGPVKDKKIGVGFSLYNDLTGITHKTGVYGHYSYRMNISENNRIFFGLSIGVLDNRIDFSKQKVKDVTEVNIENQYDSKTAVDGSFGVMYQYKSLELGASVPQILGGTLTYVNGTDARSYYNLNRHYLGTAKYSFLINKEKNITVYPLVLVRTMPGVPIQYDVNGVLDWAKVGWLGISYKNEYAYAFNAGVRLNGLSIGYVYDVVTSPLAAYAGSSSEILIGYSFKFPEKNKDLEKSYDSKLLALAKKVKQLQDQNAKDKVELDTLKNRIKSIEFSKDVEAQMGTTYVLSMVHFATKSYELNKKSRAKLKDLVEFLEMNPEVKIQIQGHTDDVGTSENNDILSENRAKAVLEYLVEKGIDPERLAYKAFGESRPMVIGTTPEARALNRRTEFIITSK